MFFKGIVRAVDWSKQLESKASHIIIEDVRSTWGRTWFLLLVNSADPAVEQMRKYWCSVRTDVLLRLLCTAFYINVREGMPEYGMTLEC